MKRLLTKIGWCGAGLLGIPLAVFQFGLLGVEWPRAGRMVAVAAPVVNANELLIRKFLTENVNDPGKLEIVEFSEPYALEECWYWNGGDHWDDREARALGFQGETTWRPFGMRGVAYVVKFRASNALGAKLLMRQAFILQNWKVTAMIDADSFSPEQPVQRTDPYLEQLAAPLQRGR